MGKKYKRNSKKRGGKNCPAKERPAKSKHTPAQSEQPPQARLQKPESPRSGKRHWSLKVFFAVISFLIFLIGFLGFEALWPRLLINPSPAVSSGISAFQFELANQAIYHVKIVKAELFAIKLSFPNFPTAMIGIGLADLTNWDAMSRRGDAEKGSIQNMVFGLYYTNEVIHGHDSITIKPDAGMQFTSSLGQIKTGSKMVVKITYKLPLAPIEKTDSSCFEVGNDFGGNPIWIKIPIPNDFNPQKFGGLETTAPIQ